jgi:hypothetical protein
MPVQTAKINDFSAGELSKRALGRSNSNLYARGLRECVNFLPLPEGGLQTRPGTIDVAEIKTSANKGRLIPFKFGRGSAFALEFGDLYFRVYRNNAGTYERVGTVEVTSPYATADLPEIQFTQSADTLYLFHPDYYPRKVLRRTDDDWDIAKLQFNPEPTSTIDYYPNHTLNIETGIDSEQRIVRGPWANSDEGKLIIAGSGRALISAVVYGEDTGAPADFDRFALVHIISPFDSTSYAFSKWHLKGSPLGELAIARTALAGEQTILKPDSTDYYSKRPATTGLAGQWVESGSGTDEWYYDRAVDPFYNHATSPITEWTEPDKVYHLGTDMAAGTAGTLTAGQWDWANNDALGYNTVYVRLSGTTADPNDLFTSENSLTAVEFWHDDTLELFFARGPRQEHPYMTGLYIKVHSGILKIENDYNATDYVTGKSGTVNRSMYVIPEILATVIQPLSATTTTYDWSLLMPVWNYNGEAFYTNKTDIEGNVLDVFPRSGTFYQDRLVMAGTGDFPQSGWISQTGDYENHLTGSNDADAIAFTLNSRQVNDIKWITARDGLIASTDEFEWLIDSVNGLLTPSTIYAKDRTAHGSEELPPIIVDNAVLFMQQGGRKLRALGEDFNVRGYTAPNLAKWAYHMTEGGVSTLSYQQEPLSIVWMPRDDGQLIGLTFNRTDDMLAWHRQKIGGTFSSSNAVVESVISLTHPTDDYDELWMIVKRTVNSATVRRIEVMTKLKDEETDLSQYHQLDGAITFAGGSETSTVTGLTQFEGESVGIVDSDTGGYYGEFTVSGGQADITPFKVTNALVGYRYNCDMKPVNLAPGSKQTIVEVVIDFLNTVGGQIGKDASNLDDIKFRTTDDTMDSPPDIFEGEVKVNVKSAIDRRGEFLIRQPYPMPMTIRGIWPDVDANK